MPTKKRLLTYLKTSYIKVGKHDSTTVMNFNCAFTQYHSLWIRIFLISFDSEMI